MSDRETEINEIIEQIKKEWVIKDWIDSQFLESKENNYDELLNYVIRFWYGAPTEPPFTEHGIGHCRAVERNIQRIVELYRIKLNIQEKFLLSATSYLHDISLKADWEKSSQDIFRLYEDHHIKSASLLMEKYLKIGLDETFASIISVLIKFHRKKEDLNNCPQKSILDNGFVRPRLISAIFRLGDAIHVDSSRVREPNWRYLLYRANIPLDVKFHWIKSFLVPAIALNASDKTIDVQINIPDVFFREDQRENAMNQRIGLLGSSIRQLLQEEVDSVNHVLSKYSRFVISEVRYMINQIPDNRKNRNQELIRFIFDYSATYSPSASMVIETALENIIQSTGRFYREQFNAVSDYWNIMNNLVNSTRSFLEEFLKDRPCHLGLNNMCRIIESIGKIVLEKTSENSGLKQQNALRTIKGIYSISTEIMDLRKKNKQIIADKFRSLINSNLFEGKDNGITFVLFGNSSLIRESLEALDSDLKKQAVLYICECRGKTKYASNNRISYSDAFAYALNLKQADYNDIRIIPDIALAKILSQYSKKECFIIIGSNGISTNGECAHTIGHLAITNLAQFMSRPIILISDTFKIGSLTPKPEATREGWYTTDVNYIRELDRNNIQIFCPREDIIKISDIDYLVTEDGTFRPRDECEKINDRLKSMYKNTMRIISEIIESNPDLKDVIGQNMKDLKKDIEQLP